MEAPKTSSGVTGGQFSSASPQAGGTAASKSHLQIAAIVGRIVDFVPVFVGGVFLFYGASKVANLSATIVSIDFLVHHKAVSKPLAAVVAAVDVYLGILLFFGGGKRRTVRVALAFLTVYTLFLCYLVSMKNPPNCGCGGMIQFFASNRANAAMGVLRNICLCGMLGCYLHVTNSRAFPITESTIS